MQETLISIRNINLTFNKKKVLDNISFDVKRKDFITIIGPNGAGKTSLIRTILGILKLNSGKVIKKKGIKIGYVPQKLILENAIPVTVEYFLKLCQKEVQIEDLAKRVDILPLLKKQFHVLSGGERQRVLLAKALIEKPDLLILDEVTQNLDINTQLSFYQLIQDLYLKENLSILMISHNLHMVMSISKKVICLFKHICCMGEPVKVANHPEFISIFGKNMSELVSIYNHYHSHKH